MTPAQLGVLYVVTMLVFFGLDSIMIPLVIKPVFDKHLGDHMLTVPRFLPAGFFYVLYGIGVLWLVGIPALTLNSPLHALINGAVLGAMCYGTYEFTNFATLKRWSIEQVALDVTWGTILTALSVAVGVFVTMKVVGGGSGRVGRKD